jgi:predicted XRE-type DNA-binding protein
MIRKRYDSVWDAIEETAEEAQNMKLRSTLMMALQEHIARVKLNQAQAAKLFGVTQPRISNLMHGKIDLFALDTLVNMASAAGMRVEMRLRKAA